MKKRVLYSGIAAIFILVATIATWEIYENNRTIEPPYPAEWDNLALGMTLSRVSELIGMELSNLIDVKTAQYFKLNIEGTELVLLTFFHQANNGDYIVDGLVRYKKRDDIIYQRQKFPW